MGTIYKKSEEEYATVKDVSEMLLKLIEDGFGEYQLGCNDEFIFAVKNESPRLDTKFRMVDFGGYV